MRKIEWKPKGSSKYASARIGNVMLYCNSIFTRSAKRRWHADVSICQLSSTMRHGPVRQSLSRAKEDAIRMARELLLDYHAVVTAEMKNFDLLE